MPLHLGHISRRELLRRAALGASILALPSSVWAAPGADPDRLALFSDTHISEKPGEMNGSVNMTEHLRQAVSEMLAGDRLPAGLLINGDCAYLRGLSGDYGQLVELLKPVREARMPVHFVLGNHDHRDNIRTEALKTGEEVVAGKQVSVVKTPRANLFLLDSLDKTNVTPGVLGEDQLTWLARALDRNANRPAVIFVHHQPHYPEFGTTGGITDTEPLFKILTPRDHVKALFFGHTHHWLVKEREGIHCVNLPPVAYVFNKTDPSGWVDLQLREYGATIRLNCLDKGHTAHGEEHRLTWR